MINKTVRDELVHAYFLEKRIHFISSDNEAMPGKVISFLDNNPRVDEVVRKDEHFLLLCSQLYMSNPGIFDRKDLPVAWFVNSLFKELIYLSHVQTLEVGSDERIRASYLTNLGMKEICKKELLFCENYAFQKARGDAVDFSVGNNTGFWFYPSNKEIWHTYFLARHIMHAFQLNVENDEFMMLKKWIQDPKNKSDEKYQPLWEYVFELLITADYDFKSLKRFVDAFFPDEFVPPEQMKWLLGAMDALMMLKSSNNNFTREPIGQSLLSMYELSQLKEYKNLSRLIESGEGAVDKDARLPVSAVTDMISVIGEQYAHMQRRESPVLKSLRLSLAPVEKQNGSTASHRKTCTLV